MKKAVAVFGLAVALQGCGQKAVSAACPSRLPGWTKPADGMDPHGIHSTVTMSGKQVFWDGQPVDARELERRLTLAPRLNPVDHVLFDPAGAANCHEAERVRDEINRRGDCQGQGLCGQGTASEFKRLREAGRAWSVKLK
jgi:hypothetical protein